MSEEEKSWPPPVDHSKLLQEAKDIKNKRHLKNQLRGNRRAAQALIFFIIPIFALGICVQGVGKTSHKVEMVGVVIAELYFVYMLRQIKRAETKLR